MSDLLKGLDRLLMLQMGNNGNTKGHIFLEKMASWPMRNSKDADWRCRGDGNRIFIPPKPEDRVVMFSDKSGVYVHSDGLCTYMDKDISNEVKDWQEVR